MNMMMKAMIMILIQVKRKQTITQQTPIIIKITLIIKMTETTMTGDQLISIIISIITRFVFKICILVNFEKCNFVA